MPRILSSFAQDVFAFAAEAQRLLRCMEINLLNIYRLKYYKGGGVGVRSYQTKGTFSSQFICSFLSWYTLASLAVADCCLQQDVLLPSPVLAAWPLPRGDRFLVCYLNGKEVSPSPPLSCCCVALDQQFGSAEPQDQLSMGLSSTAPAGSGWCFPLLGFLQN